MWGMSAEAGMWCRTYVEGGKKKKKKKKADCLTLSHSFFLI